MSLLGSESIVAVPKPAEDDITAKVRKLERAKVEWAVYRAFRHDATFSMLVSSSVGVFSPTNANLDFGGVDRHDVMISAANRTRFPYEPPTENAYHVLFLSFEALASTPGTYFPFTVAGPNCYTRLYVRGSTMRVMNGRAGTAPFNLLPRARYIISAWTDRRKAYRARQAHYTFHWEVHLVTPEGTMLVAGETSRGNSAPTTRQAEVVVGQEGADHIRIGSVFFRMHSTENAINIGPTYLHVRNAMLADAQLKMIAEP